LGVGSADVLGKLKVARDGVGGGHIVLEKSARSEEGASERRGNNFQKKFQELVPEIQGQNLALTVASGGFWYSRILDI